MKVANALVQLEIVYKVQEHKFKTKQPTTKTFFINLSLMTPEWRCERLEVNTLFIKLQEVSLKAKHNAAHSLTLGEKSYALMCF